MDNSSSNKSRESQKSPTQPQFSPAPPQYQQTENNPQLSQFLPEFDNQTQAQFSNDMLGRFQHMRHLMKNARSTINCFTFCLNFVFLLPIVIILAVYDQDCNSPIRTWLLVQALITGIYMFITLIYQILVYTDLYLKFSGLMGGLHVLLGLFGIAWIIVGSVWLFGDEDCSDDFEAGYILTLVYLIMAYTGFGCFCMCTCCVLCCAGVIGVSIKKND